MVFREGSGAAELYRRYRNVKGDRPLDVADLGKAIKPDFRTSELPWLIGVVDRLAASRVVHSGEYQRA